MRIHSETGRCVRPSIQLIAVANRPSAIPDLHVVARVHRAINAHEMYHMLSKHIIRDSLGYRHLPDGPRCETIDQCSTTSWEES